MNRYVRAIFMPIMILAGIFTGTMCSLIVAPIALYHWFKERKLIPEDLSNDDIYVRTYHEQFKNKQ